MNQQHAHSAVFGVGEDHLQCLGQSLGEAGRLFVFNGDREFIDVAVLLEPKTARKCKREVGENVVGGERRVELISGALKRFWQKNRNAEVAGTEEYRILTRNFSVQQFLADSNFAEDGGSRRSIESESPRLITGITFKARA